MVRTIVSALAVVGVALLALPALGVHLSAPRGDDPRQKVQEILAEHEAEWARRRATHGPLRPESEGRQTDPDALARANALLNETIGKRPWGAPDAREMRSLILRLSVQDRGTVLVRFARALNGSELALVRGQAPL